MKRAQKQGKRLVTDQITLLRGGSERNFAVRVTTRRNRASRRKAMS